MNYVRWLLLIFLAALAMFGVFAVISLRGPASLPTPAKVTEDSGETALFPQQRAIDGYTLTIYAPQVRTWTAFERFTSTIAFALTPARESVPRYGTATVAGDTVVDMDNRIVTIRSPQVTDVTFANSAPAEYTAAVMDATTRRSLAVRLDLFLAYVADEALPAQSPTGFNMSPPPILVRSTETVLLFIDGTPVMLAVPNTDLDLVVNANWPLLRHRKGHRYYLLAQDQWLTSDKLEYDWQAATSLPADMANLPPSDDYSAIRSAVPLKEPARKAPQVVYAYRPTELIVIDGRPSLETIAGAGALQWVTNTHSPLFKLGSTWYFLAAGRWFTTTDLDKGPWTFAAKLPDAFAAIPADHPRSAVRAAVPGTVEAKMAALEVSLPRRTRVRSGGAPTVDITYAGSPEFEMIPGTQVARAVNTGFDVFLYQDRYYLCYAGAWYAAASPLGPWGATADVPPAIYTIPPQSPAYNVTDVEVTASTGDEIEYTSTDAYDDGVYVADGTTWYGTGWYYPPYIYGPIYYPYWGSYGHGSWYNPVTGRYGSRSIWYGPYGGYSYTQGYNPRTGRYGYVEAAWDGQQWASFGEIYNPRTGIGVQTERTRDFYAGTSTVERETSQGGISSVQRSREGGAVSTQRTVTSASGDTYTTNTVRSDGRGATVIEGSGGGEAISVSHPGGNRVTVAESGGGDVYAGYNGNIYKKTSDGWQRLDNGAWKPAQSSPYVERERPPPPKPPAVVSAPSAPAASASVAAPQDAAANERARAELRANEERERARAEQRANEDRERAQLDDDYEARERGDRQFRQRAVQRGGSRRR